MSREFSAQEREREFPDEPGYVWEWFKDLELELVNYLEYTPLTENKENINVWSPRLANLMVNVGGIIDSFSRYALSHSHFNRVQFDDTTISKLRNDPKSANMSHFRQAFEQTYDISRFKLHIIPEGKEPVFTVRPFSSFQSGTSPDWWSDVYNKLKHKRLSSSEYVKRATVKNVIKGIGGLFLLQLMHPPTNHYLLARGIIRTLLPSYTSIELRKDLVDYESWDEVDKIIAGKSSLFGFVYPTKKLREETINTETSDTYSDYPEELFSHKNPVSWETWQKIR